MAPTLRRCLGRCPPPMGAKFSWGGPSKNCHLPMTKFVYLASQSPRRRQLLEQLGVRFELLLPDAGEDAESLEIALENEAPHAYVARVTGLKFEASLARLRARGLPAAPVLCSDTTVALGRSILGKPADAAEARAMLSRLSGRTHRVLTSVVVGTERRQAQVTQVSRVTFMAMTPAQIRQYVASGEPMGKAGAYAVQGAAAAFISHISGSFSGIMGLPAFETSGLLKSFGLGR